MGRPPGRVVGHDRQVLGTERREEDNVPDAGLTSHRAEGVDVAPGVGNRRRPHQEGAPTPRRPGV